MNRRPTSRLRREIPPRTLEEALRRIDTLNRLLTSEREDHLVFARETAPHVRLHRALQQFVEHVTLRVRLPHSTPHEISLDIAALDPYLESLITRAARESRSFTYGS